MKTNLPLDQMTTSEKLSVLEEVWHDLCRTPDSIPSPSWHADILSAREKRVQQGSSTFVEWTDAKEKMRDSAK